MILKIFFPALLLASIPLQAAEFEFIKQSGPEWSYRLSMSGPIEAGDDKKFQRVLAKNPELYLLAFNMSVDSRGGDVAAAVSLAKEVEASALALTVIPGEVCFSACFLLYASSQYRMSFGGKIGLHRPYVPLDDYVFDSSEHAPQQQVAAYAMRQFLAARSIPSDLIDKMMSLPSVEIYEMAGDDLQRTGYFSPLAEELGIRNCAISNRSNIQAWRDKDWGKISCVQNEVLQPMRFGYLEKLVGGKAAADYVESALERKRRASPAG